MSTHVITATEAARTLSNILSKVLYRGESFKIKRGKEIIAKIVPVKPNESSMKVSELNEFIKNLPNLEPEDCNAFEETIHEIRLTRGFPDNSQLKSCKSE